MIGGIELNPPYPKTGMTSEKWLQVPPQWFLIRNLVLTQEGIYFKGLVGEPSEPVGGDLLPHVVRYEGVNYLEDGHTRLMRALASGQQMLKARCLKL